MSDPLIPKRTSRGFNLMDPVPGAYGGEVVLYESSSANEPHLWLHAWSYKDMNNQTGHEEATLHLHLDQAKILRDQLTVLIDNHYQLGGS